MLDNSEKATDIMRQYEILIGMTAVPMSYLIDREGKVADAWYGFDKKKQRDVLWLVVD